MITGVATVRVGVLVERRESEFIPFDYRMFFCRQRAPGDEKHCPVAEWAREEVDLLTVRSVLRPRSMKVGEVRRYWVHMTMVATRDYWGECDTDIEVHSIKRADK